MQEAEFLFAEGGHHVLLESLLIDKWDEQLVKTVLKIKVFSGSLHEI